MANVGLLSAVETHLFSLVDWQISIAPGFNPGKKDSIIPARQDEPYKIRSHELARNFRDASGEVLRMIGEHRSFNLLREYLPTPKGWHICSPGF